MVLPIITFTYSFPMNSFTKIHLLLKFLLWHLTSWLLSDNFRELLSKEDICIIIKISIHKYFSFVLSTLSGANERCLDNPVLGFTYQITPQVSGICFKLPVCMHTYFLHSYLTIKGAMLGLLAFAMNLYN